MRWYFNRAKDVLKLGATCASSGIAMALRDREKITMKVEFTEKKKTSEPTLFKKFACKRLRRTARSLCYVTSCNSCTQLINQIFVSIFKHPKIHFNNVNIL